SQKQNVVREVNIDNFNVNNDLISTCARISTNENSFRKQININVNVESLPLTKSSGSLFNHNVHFGCSNCIQEGDYIEYQVTFPSWISEIHATLRSDESFKFKQQEEHHKFTSSLEELNIGMVIQFSLNYMHLIKNLSRLVSSQITRKKNKKFFCDRRSTIAPSDCRGRQVVPPIPVEFGNHCNKERVSFIVYADLECVLRKTESDKENSFYILIVFHVDVLPITKEKYISVTKHISIAPKIKMKRIFRSYLDKDKLKIVRSELDIFENFRNSCIASYCLDPAHYYTLPGFTWDAMLKHTHVRFELLTDIDMITFERGIRGGLSQCFSRYAQANNKYMRSKVCLYEFHREYMSPMYRDKCKIMYTDTDSLIYHIECDDVYKNMKHDIARYERLSSRQRVWYANKKVLGLMKDENNGAIMAEFVGLRVKMYIMRVDGKKDTKKAKGIKNNVVARTITFDDYTHDDKRYVVPNST
ncbi:hypothetical protein ALC53_01878, partial [Atta colombica]